MEPYVPSEAEKGRALGDLYYEVRQLWASTHLAGQPVLVHNAFLESRLVHVRVLLDFFERSSRSHFRDAGMTRENDDVLSKDYGFQPHRIDLGQIYRERLNKDLVHLAYSRGHRLPESKGWPTADVVIPIAERAIEFIDFMSDEALWPTPGVSVQEWRELRANLESMRRAFRGAATDA